MSKAVIALGACYGVLFSEEKGEVHPRTWWGLERPEEGHANLARRALAQASPLVLEHPPVNAGLSLLVVPISDQPNSRWALMVAFPPGHKGLKERLPLVKLVGWLQVEIVALQEELSRKEEQVQELMGSTLEAQEAERERICLEVHDGVTQTLASAFQYLQALESTPPEGAGARQLLLRASGLVRQAIQESRDVINSLQPTVLRDLGLIATLCQEMRQLEAETGWEVEFTVDPIRLPSDMETGLYRIIREAVANARKHSATARIRVQLKKQDDRILVEVKDWGVGFTPFMEKRKSLGLGFHSMKRRAGLWGGTCSVESAPGQGTTVRVEIPLGKEKDDRADKDAAGG